MHRPFRICKFLLFIWIQPRLLITDLTFYVCAENLINHNVSARVVYIFEKVMTVGMYSVVTRLNAIHKLLYAFRKELRGILIDHRVESATGLTKF